MKLDELFYFHKNDRIVVFFLVAVAVVAATAIYLLDDAEFESKDNTSAASIIDGDDGNGTYAIKKGNGNFYYVGERRVELFAFDPNTADSTTLLKLGLQPWMVRNIYKYRAAGGTFRQKEDFARVYGLTKKQYEMLAPYIRISDDYRAAADFYLPSPAGNGEYPEENNRAYVPRDTMAYPLKLKSGEHISVNNADTMQLKKIPGIGSAYSRAIVRRRDKLGGFSSKAQLMEIDGFPQEALAYIEVDANEIRKMNLNKLTYSQLRQHPYINYYQARDIVDYRRLRGTLKSLADLRLLKSFTAGDIERLKPYVEF